MWTTTTMFFVTGLVLRVELLGLGAILEEIQLHFSSPRAVVGLLVTLPLVAMGVFAPLAAHWSQSFGLERVVVLGLALISAFGFARASASSMQLMLAASVGLGLGIAFVQTLLPSMVKVHARSNVAIATTAYVSGMQIGVAGAAAVAGVMAAAFGWRSALFGFSALAALTCLVAGLFFTRGGTRTVSQKGIGSRNWRFVLRHRSASLLVIIFGLHSGVFFGLGAWLSPRLIESGWNSSDSARAISFMMLGALVGTFLTPYLVRKSGSLARLMRYSSGLAIASLISLIYLPAYALLSSVGAGAGLSTLLVVSVQVPAFLVDDVGRVSAITGVMYGSGYLIAASMPASLGLVRDMTGSFTPVLWLLTLMLGLVFTACCMPAIREVG